MGSIKIGGNTFAEKGIKINGGALIDKQVKINGNVFAEFILTPSVLFDSEELSSQPDSTGIVSNNVLYKPHFFSISTSSSNMVIKGTVDQTGTFNGVPYKWQSYTVGTRASGIERDDAIIVQPQVINPNHEYQLKVAINENTIDADMNAGNGHIVKTYKFKNTGTAWQIWTEAFGNPRWISLGSSWTNDGRFPINTGSTAYAVFKASGNNILMGFDKTGTPIANNFFRAATVGFKIIG